MSTLGMSYQQVMEQIDSIVEETIKLTGKKQSVVYSAYEEDEYGNPINNLKEIAIKGMIKFVDGEDFVSLPLFSPTWLDIAIVANEMINQTKDYQNRHFKDFDVFDNQDGVMIAKLIMGS
jgi:hypothetical protein